MSAPHAKAFESLKHPRDGQPDYGITRIYDAECIACQVTGWEPQEVLRYRSGFVNEEFAQNDLDRERSPLLRGVQCENCHGPGSIHVDLELQWKLGDIKANDPELLKWRGSMHVNLKVAEEQVCRKCHDFENSPEFEFEKYWKEVQHPGRD